VKREREMSKFFGNAKIEPDVNTSLYIEKDESFYVISLGSLLTLYGGFMLPRLHSFEELKRRNLLRSFINVKPSDTAIYVSRETSYTSNDNRDSVHMHHLIRILEILPTTNVSMNAFHRILYKQNHNTTDEEWKQILNPKHTWIYFDKICAPKEAEGWKCLKRMPYKISRSTFLMVICPTMENPNLCYRTYRGQAKCVFEMFSAFLMTSSEPLLLVRSSTSVAEWISPLESLKLTIGSSSFECCESNHESSSRCTQVQVYESLRKIICLRKNKLFEVQRYLEARCVSMLAQWWLRDLKRGKEEDSSTNAPNTLLNLRRFLRWDYNHDSKWIDRDRFPIPLYVCVFNNIHIVKEIMEEINRCDFDFKRKLLCMHCPRSGVTNLGITGYVTPLIGAMYVCSSIIYLV